ncbi:MAG: TonB-dependent receptor [Sphingomonadaceae bacterium]
MSLTSFNTQLRCCVAGSTLLLTGLASAAMAQPVDDSAGAPQANTGSAGMEIVVTAQRRSERLEDVPISITSVSGAALENAGVTRVGQLPSIVPGLRLDQSGAFSQPTIRGVGSSVAGPGLSSNVATYIDGFYVPNSLTSDLSFMSVQNVQVLKGPQGTLFGRNATGGAILVTTKEPSFTPTMTAKASYQSFDRLNLGFYGATGLTDKIAMDVTGYYERGDGFVRSLIDDHQEARFEKWAVRSKILAELSDTAKITLAYSHQFSDDPTFNAKNSYNGLSAGSVVPGALTPSERGKVANDYETESRINGDAVYLTGEFELGAVSVKSQTQYRDERTFIANDNDSSSAAVIHSNYRSIDKSFTQELNFSGNIADRLDWFVGGYYFWNDIAYPSVNVSFQGGPFVKTQGSVNKTNAYALFADGTYQIGDRLFVTGGLRYSIEKADLHLDMPTDGINDGKETWKSLTPRAVIRYEVGDRSSVYASYSKGFKSGQLPAGSNRIMPVDPEKIDAFEIGYKTARAGIRLDLSAYYYDYKDLQVTAFLSPGSIVRNAASAEIYGAEAQLAADLTDQLSVSLGGAYTHAEYKNFDTAVAYVQQPSGFFAVQTVDASGLTMQRAPKFTGSADVNYTMPLWEGQLLLNANLYYTTRIYFDPVEQFYQNKHALLNLRATYTTADDKWAFSVFGTNVTDKKYRNQVQPATGAVQQGYGEPAAIGVSAQLRF